MTKVNIYDAKTHFSQLLVRVEAGEEIVIARAGRPIARLSPIGTPEPSRVFGRDAGLFDVPDDFDEPLPPDVLDGFLG
jgi:prevent-host-death family protein